ncbi:MAG: alpha/beta fold hydrolase [Candidatus Sericytochromatia bacterium]
MKKGRMIVTNGIRLHVAEAGKPGNTCLLFLHGFPDFHHGWRYQAAFFDEKKCYAVMPDQRGYNLSEKPKALDAYGIDTLAQDIKGLIEGLGQNVWLVGHNWGGTVAWRVAQKYPEQLQGMILLNSPHPDVFWEQLKANRQQWMKNSQWLFYQVPGLAENILRIGNWEHFSHQFKRNARKGTINEGDLKKYREAWSQPGAFHAMLNWYRAFMQKKVVLKTSVKINIPVLFVQGMQDQSLTQTMVKESLSHCLRATLKQIPNAGHWAHLDQNDVVNKLILDFICQKEYDYTQQG